MPRLTRRAAIPLAVAAALAALPAAARAQKLAPATGALESHDVNQVFLRVDNRGGFGLSVDPNDPTGNFPRGTDNRYLFGAGLWIGGIGDVNADGVPDTVTSTGYQPTFPRDDEWIAGVPNFDPGDPRFQILDSTEPTDQPFFPTTPVADQELFAIYSDRYSQQTSTGVSIPLGVVVRQRSFAFTDPGLDSTIFFQWDLTNISDVIRSTGYAIRDLETGVVLDPDIGAVDDDAAAPLTIDGKDVLLIWDADFRVSYFDGPAGFLAVVPLEGGDVTAITQMTSSTQNLAVLPVPLQDDTQYMAMAGIAPWTPTIRSVGFDLRALIGWGSFDLPIGATRRTAAAIVFAAPTGDPPAVLQPTDSDHLTEDEPVLAGIVEAVRRARTAYADRLAGLPPLLDFPGSPEEPAPGEGLKIHQNYPNPFRDQTTIEYNVPAPTPLRIQVFDLRGRLVATLVDGTVSAGLHRIFWDGHSNSGIDVPAGIYVIRMTASGHTTSVRAMRLP